MSNHKAISADDPNAVEKLTKKIETYKKDREQMKNINAYYRKHGTCTGFPGMPDDTASRLDKAVEHGYSWEKLPFPDYKLTNSYREIQRLEKRVKEITKNRDAGFSDWEFFSGRADANTELNRLQLFFDEKPNEVERNLLKANGFKWAPSQGAWQRQLNDNAIYAAERLDFLRPLDGKTVREHQPKSQVKCREAR